MYQGMLFNGSMVALEASGVRFESYYPDQIIWLGAISSQAKENFEGQKFELLSS